MRRNKQAASGDKEANFFILSRKKLRNIGKRQLEANKLLYTREFTLIVVVLYSQKFRHQLSGEKDYNSLNEILSKYRR